MDAPSSMKTAYSNYGLPNMALEDASALVAEAGFEGIELYVGPQHLDTLPERIGAERRRRLRDLLGRLGLGIPALVTYGSVLSQEPGAQAYNLRRLTPLAQLARDVGAADPPVLSMGLGGKAELWDAERDELVRQLLVYADAARNGGWILAPEIHAWSAAGCLQRAQWLLEHINSRWVRLHFDIGQFLLAGESLSEAVRTLVPYTAHTHVCDLRLNFERRYDPVPLGQGDLDLGTYVRAMHAAGWTGYLTVEVSARLWSRSDYDPVPLVHQAHGALRAALQELSTAGPFDGTVSHANTL